MIKFCFIISERTQVIVPAFGQREDCSWCFWLLLRKPWFDTGFRAIIMTTKELKFIKIIDCYIETLVTQSLINSGDPSSIISNGVKFTFKCYLCMQIRKWSNYFFTKRTYLIYLINFKSKPKALNHTL